MFIHCLRGCCGVCSNAFVDDCVEYFYGKRVLCLAREQLKPVRKVAFRSHHHSDPSSAALPKHCAMNQAIDEAGDRVMSSRRPYHQRNVWCRSDTKNSDVAAEVLESAATDADQQLVAGETSRGRKTRFRPRNSEPVDNLDMDHVLSFLDQMDFKPSKNKMTTANCTTAANVGDIRSVVPASLVVSSDVMMKLTPSTKERHAVPLFSGSRMSVSDREEEAVFGDTNLAMELVHSVDVDSCMMTRNADTVPSSPRAGSSAVAHIPGTIVAWKTLSGEDPTSNTMSTDLDNCTSAERLRFSQMETVEYESGTLADRSGSSGKVDFLKQTVVDSLPTSIAAHHSINNNTQQQLDEVANIVINAKHQEVVSSSHLWPVGRGSHLQRSSDVVHTPRLLSADSSYFLEQEDGDVIIESSSEEDFDD